VARRRFSAAGLGALAALVVVLLVGVTALPIRSCPTCRGVAKRVAAEAGFLPDIACPECADRGAVTETRRWMGSLVPPAVTRLLQCWREERKNEFVPSLDQIAALSGADPEAVLGTRTFGGKWRGEAVFIRSEGKDFVLVNLRGDERRWDGLAGLVLLGMDGRILDYFQCGSANGWTLAMEPGERASKDERVATVTAQSLSLADGVLPPPAETESYPVKAAFEGGARRFPAEPGAKTKGWLVRVKSGRFEIVPASRQGTP
jgi:hypothetical protein